MCRPHGAGRSRLPCCWPNPERARRRPSRSASRFSTCSGCSRQRSPLVVAADDLRWVDPASAAALQVAFRRLRDEPVGLLATMRDSPEETSVIEQSFEDVRLNHLTVGPLDARALHTVLSQRVGIDLPHAEVLRVRDATAGNPFFAVELGRELARSGTLDPRQPLPVPESLARLLQMRLDRLSPTTTEVLLIVALAGRPTIDLIVAVHGDRQLVREALDEAKREGIIESRGGHVALSHPLFASVLQEHAPADVRRSTHLALAHTVADVEERARHRAHGTIERDAEVADELEAAGDHAAARGVPSAAADLYELAADLTPDDVLARRRRLRAATLHRFAGKPARGRILIDRLLGEVPSGVERADVLLELASAWYSGDPRSKVELCDEALVEATGDPARQSGIWAQRSALQFLAARHSRAARRCTKSAAAGRRGRGRAAHRHLHRSCGFGRVLRGADHFGPDRAWRRPRGPPRSRAGV